MSEEVTVTHSDTDVLTHCTFSINNKCYDVKLTDVELKWHIAGSTEQKGLQTVRITDVLSVSLKKTVGSSNDDLCVNYVRQEKKLILKSCCVAFKHDDSQIISNLHQQISGLIRKIEQRPQKLLVLINPVSGRSKGQSTYEQKVAPIFKEAGIETDVIVTEKAHHAEEILSTYDIKSISGLVLVSGDGLYHEAVNGLMRRLATEQNVNVDDPDVTVPTIDITVGLIPCGTGNGIAYNYYGNYDVKTAALAIAIGYSSPANLMSVHSDDKLVAYSSLLVGYGVWSDLIHTTESRRSQGRMRYPIAILEQMFIKTLRRMQLTVQYKSNQDLNIATESRDTDDVLDGVKLTDNSSTEVADDSNASNRSSKSTTIKENTIGAILFMLTPVNDSTMTTKPDLSKAVMYLNKSAQRTKYISFMFRLMTLNLAVLEARDDISVLPGQQWKVKLDEPSQPDTQDYEVEHFMNIDGEAFTIPKPEYQAKLLTGKLNLYSNMPYATKRFMKKI
ncbi:uncharacterized protein LOC132727944 isoform X2 [Ruditapes philippinarum]|nr:uncharacterized protein LOC132727944 isoform X2 [Ruditapes philippinarum]